LVALETQRGGIAEYVDQLRGRPVKLHLGCGGMRWRDFVNVDFYPYDTSVSDSSRSGCVADVFADMRSLGLPNDSVDEIFTSHTVDHFTRWDAIDMFRDWHRMLKSGGVLMIEVADFWRCVLWLFHPVARNRHLARTQFYGNQWDRLDFETHRYLWSAGELAQILRGIGFASVTVSHKTLTHVPGRDMQVRAEK
jgi:hypothetical protein